MAKAATLNLDIVAKADSAIAAFDKVKEKATGGMSGVKIATTAAATAILAGLGDATKAAAEHEQGVAKLSQAYKNAGVSTKGMAGDLDEIEARSRRTGQSTEDNIAAYTELITVTHNTAKAHSELATAQDLAAYKGISVKEAAEAITRASVGNTRALKDMGIATKDAAGHQLPTAILMERLTAAVHGQADAMGNTAVGQMNRYHESLDQTKEKIGEALIPVLQTLLKTLQPVFNWLDKNQAVLKTLTPFVAAAAAAIIAVNLATKAWAAAQAILNAVMDANPIGIVVLAVAALTVGVIYAYNHFKVFRQVITDVWGAIRAAASWIAAHWQPIIEIMLGPTGVLIAHFNTVKAVLEDIINALESVGRAVSKALGWLGKLPSSAGSLISKINPFSLPAGAAPMPSVVNVTVLATPGDDLPEVVYRALRDYQRRHVRPELAPLFAYSRG
jgi:hypothetical protein